MTLEQATQWLWQGGLGVVPAALAALLVVKLRWIRPATKHLLCVSALGCLLAAPLLAALGPRLPTFSWLTAQRTSPPEAQQRRADASRTKTDHTLRRDAKRDVDHDSDRAAAAHEAALPRRPYPWRSWPEDAPLFDAPEPLWVRPLPPPTPLDALRDDAGERRLAGAPPSEAAALALGESAQDIAAWPIAPSAALDLDIDIETRAFSPATDQTPPSQAAAPDAAAVSPPAPAPAPAEEAGPATIVSQQLEALRAWGPWLGLFVEALRSAPPLPTALWLGGSALTLALLLVQTQRGRRLVASASEAPPSFQAEVDCAAGRLGLSRAPIVRMTQLRVSPLIWCGRKPVLLLPEPLWSSLSREQRDAILLHELAHLKRRDHLLRWADAATAVAYWWHPLVWLLRRQVREQADLSCDAWVTALLPHRRTAYARALIQTKAFLSSPSTAGSAFALSAASSRTRRFTRRLTMVMLHRTRPGASLSGMLAALSVAALGLVGAPLLATPPADEGTAAAVHPHPEEGKEKPSGQAASEKAAPSEGETTFEKYLQEVEQDKRQAEKRARERARELAKRAKARAERAKVHAKERAERAKARAKELAERARARAEQARRGARQQECEDEERVVIQLDLDDDTDELRGMGNRLRMLRIDPDRFDFDFNFDDDMDELRDLVERLGQMRLAPGRIHLRRGPQAHAFAFSRNCDCRCSCDDDDDDEHADHDEHADRPGRMDRDGDAAVRLRVAPQAGASARRSAEAGALVEREYRLSSAGKLADLVRLMAREDVPILIRPEDDAVTVFATPQQQRIFAAFVRMIDPAAKVEAGGRVAAPSRAPRAPRPPRAPQTPRTPDLDEGFDGFPPAMRQSVEEASKHIQQAVEAARRQLEPLAQELEKIRMRRADVEQEMERIERLYEELEEQAEAHEEEADTLREQAEELEDKAGDASDTQLRDELLTRARALREKAAALLSSVKPLAEQGAKLEQQYNTFEQLVEQLEEQQEQLEERLESLRERLRDMVQERQHEMNQRLRKALEQWRRQRSGDAAPGSDAPTAEPGAAQALTDSGALLDSAARSLAGEPTSAEQD